MSNIDSNDQLSIDNIDKKITKINHFLTQINPIKPNDKTFETLISEGNHSFELSNQLFELYREIRKENLSFLGDLDLAKIYLDENHRIKISNFPNKEKLINSLFTENKEYEESTNEIDFNTIKNISNEDQIFYQKEQIENQHQSDIQISTTKMIRIKIKNILDQEKHQQALANDFDLLKQKIKHILNKELSQNRLTANYNMFAVLSKDFNEIETSRNIDDLSNAFTQLKMKYQNEENRIKNHINWIRSFFQPSFFLILKQYDEAFKDFKDFEDRLEASHIHLPQEWLKAVFDKIDLWKKNLSLNQIATVIEIYTSFKKYLQRPPYKKPYKNLFKDFPAEESWDPLDPQKEVEPNHRIEISADKSWCIQTCGIRGNSHKHEGKHYEDYADFLFVNDWKIIVVSDGMGSAKYSRLSSYILVNEIKKSLKSSLKYLNRFNLKSLNLKQIETQEDQKNILDLLRILLMDAVQTARHMVFLKYQELRLTLSEDVKLKDFQATLLICLHHPCKGHDLTVSMQIGDGLISILTKNPNTQQYEAKLLTNPDHGEFAGQTHAVFLENMDLMIREKGRIKFSLASVTSIAVMTDGISDDFFPEKERIRELFLSEEINEMFSKSGHAQKGLYWDVVLDENPHTKLLDWLSYEKKQSYDDRSIVFAYQTNVIPMLDISI